MLSAPRALAIGAALLGIYYVRRAVDSLRVWGTLTPPKGWA